ncbi:hypothetical protein MMMB2_3165 [Mycobacterium marinum MB2]|nr:hypothetical protein MMMB2_3165 [Mycobacterium marinum MB2]
MRSTPTCAVQRKPLAYSYSRSWAPSFRHERPCPTRPPWDAHFSSPTSFATSTRTWPATASICPPTNSPHTGLIGMC